jgi:hypothetical protein
VFNNVDVETFPIGLQENGALNRASAADKEEKAA